MAGKTEIPVNEKFEDKGSEQQEKPVTGEPAGDETREEEKLDDLFAQLEEIISSMEQGNASLEDSFQMYHRGMDLLKRCNDKIDRVEKKIQILDEEGELHEFEQ